MEILKKYSGLLFVFLLLFLSSSISAQEITDSSTSHLIPSEGFNLMSFLRGVLGMVVVLGIAYIFSANRKGINWKTVRVGLTIQIILAIGILMGDKIGFNIPSIDLGFWQINRIDLRIVRVIFEFGGSIFVKILDFTRVGSEFLFGNLMDVKSVGFIFALQVLPTIIFFSALTSLLFYLGWIQIVVKGMAKLLTKMMHVSGREALSVTGNIFLGQTEAPLMIKAYLEKMTKSEILLVMIGGMATVAGGVLAAYISFLGGDDPVERLKFAKHLLAASVMAAPGAIVVSKILFPEKGVIPEESDVEMENIGSNILDAIANGTTEGLKLAANVAAMLLVFLAFIAMLNYVFSGIGGAIGLNSFMAKYTPYSEFSLESMLGLIFAPLMWLLGVVKEDIMVMGQLLGIKLVASEFVAYTQLADLKQVASTPHLMYEKSVIMATYMLCGFANFASIGIQIGGIGSLAPGQRAQLARFGMLALLGGSLASLLSATLVGMIMG